MKIQIIMPMAGQAQRFNRDSDKLVIKPLIKIAGVHMFRLAVNSIRMEELDVNLRFIVQKRHLAMSDLREVIESSYPKANIDIIDAPTRGPGDTLSQIMGSISLEDPVIVIDCDLAFSSSAFMAYLKQGEYNDTALLTFKSNNQQYSFIESENGLVTKIKEKEVISQEAVCGCYFFKSGKLLKSLVQNAKSRIVEREIFLSDLIQESLSLGLSCRALSCDTHTSFGTPQEIEEILKGHDF